MGNRFADLDLAGSELSLLGVIEQTGDDRYDNGLLCQVRKSDGCVEKIIVRCDPVYLQAAQALLDFLKNSLLDER